ncbi:MAG: FkbM family methyltransferase [Planctomycetaceae bacterium]
MFGDYCGIKVRSGVLGDQDREVVREVVAYDAYRLDLRGLMPTQESFVIDVGAHIGCFARMWHMRNPKSKIICVEVCPENWELLDVNAAVIACVEHSACTYEVGQLVLHNSVMEGGDATGGSIVTSPNVQHSGRYWRDEREIQTVTLEGLMSKYEFPRIDCLKLDCEGSEFSILENTTSLDKIGFICGEYHGRSRWETLVRSRFDGWSYCHLSGDDLGIFHLQNPRWQEDFASKVM